MTFVFDLELDHQLPLEKLRALIGGKATNLGVMASQLRLPVPPGFVVSTQACREYLAAGSWPDELDAELRLQMRQTEHRSGRGFGDAANPLLVSVRSGAPVSMPGMMDTVLNLGLNDETTRGLANATGNPAFASDCRRRFAAMFTSVTGSDPPGDPWAQLRRAIAAVFESWNSERARAYRRVEGLSDDMCTAVTVQEMVFGNSGPDSATGVLFTRNPATGERSLFGDVLFEAQGEDVVSGGRHTLRVTALHERMPEVAQALWRHANTLERYFKDMCDIEFTIDSGKLWLLQVRIGKRTPQAALRLAVEMADDADFPLSRSDAVRRVAQFLQRPPRVASRRPDGLRPIAIGLPASPGLAVGRVVTSVAAVEAIPDDQPLILVRAETSPADVPAMAKAAGVLTSRGGLASHAAVVARGWSTPAVVGAVAIEVDDGGFTLGGRRYLTGQTISIDGTTGEIFGGPVPAESTVSPEAAVLLDWSRELGIDVHEAEAPGVIAGLDPGTSEVSDVDVIRQLAIKGMATAVGLAAVLDSSVEAVQRALDDLAKSGAITSRSDLARLTRAGEARAEHLIELERLQLGADSAVACLDQFLLYDGRVKEAVTAWQMRQVAGHQIVNDHLDADYDAKVLATLQAIDDDVSEQLTAIGGAVADDRASYLARLHRAVGEMLAGDHRFVASPRVDSYHTIWFELHEYLIRLAGRTRADEASAGRA